MYENLNNTPYTAITKQTPQQKQMFQQHLYQHQQECLQVLEKHDNKRKKKCLVNQWQPNSKHKSHLININARPFTPKASET